MPCVKADQLNEIARTLFVASGVPEPEAEIVARHCTAANLAGHDSHGIIRVPDYIDRMKRGHIIPGAPWEILQESDTTTVIDGHWGFGYVVTERAMKLTIEKARKHQVAAATVSRQGHIGRLASYTLMAAANDMIGLITADSGRSPKQVVPFGGRAPRLGTNPLSVAVPSELEAPLFIDFATSVVAGGKISLAAARGQSIPGNWIIDSEGRATTDPNKRKQGGALLPLGGAEGYKGYGLAVIVEILCGLLTGLGFGVEPTGKHNDGCFLAVFNVGAFLPVARFKQEVADFAKFLKDTPPAEESRGVLYPGELEWEAESDRRRNGVIVEDATWAKLGEIAASYGLREKLGL